MYIQVVYLLVTLLGCSCQATLIPRELQTFTLEELIPLRPRFYPDWLSVHWISDTEYIYSEAGVGLRKYDAATNTYVPILNTLDLAALSNRSVSKLSRNVKYLLLSSKKQKIYRHSSIAEYEVYDLEKRTIVKLGEGPLQVVLWGKGATLAYVQNNNVFYVPDVSHPNVVTPLTTQGIPGEVYFGVADWIYEEEVFSATEAMWFSPSGSHLAVASFNDTNVETAGYNYYGYPSDINDQYPHEVQFKYPKAGRANPLVGLRVYKLNSILTSANEAWNIPAPIEAVGLDHILGKVSWASDQNLVVLWLNRRQSISILVNCDLIQDKCSIVKQQLEPNGWIDISNQFFDNTGTRMIQIEPMFLGQRRYMHAARYDLNTLVQEDLTPINSTVTEVLGWNQKTDTLYFIVAPESTPWQRQLWCSINGLLRCISCRESSCHNAGGTFSPGASFGFVTCSSAYLPSKTFLYSTMNDSLQLLKDNERLYETLSKYKLPMVLFNIISIGNGVDANVKLLLPPHIEKDKQYPLVIRVYAGPGTTMVKDTFDLEYYNTYLAGNRSFIVAAIDVRGSGVMGVEALHAVNNALGTVEVTDTLAAIRRLKDIYSFIDPKRIGVWGWSYGGFATTTMLIKDDQKTIACGAAVAPVTSWLYYDTIYTERFMDTPQANPLGYQQSDVLAHAEKLRGRRFLLVHGTGDDNVHYQHSLQLSKVLQHADIAFQQMSYTDEAHSLLGVSRHFYHTLDNFWTECFNS